MIQPPWQPQTNLYGLLSTVCCYCNTPLTGCPPPFEEAVYCLQCWQRPANTGRFPAHWPPCILAVDDDLDSLLFISLALESFGFPYVGLPQGQKALSFLQHYPVDLLLLDAVLTDIETTVLIQAVRQNEQMKALPIVAVTALAEVRDRNRLLGMGFDDYLSKPYQLPDLKAIIVRHLSKP